MPEAKGHCKSMAQILPTNLSPPNPHGTSAPCAQRLSLLPTRGFLPNQTSQNSEAGTACLPSGPSQHRTHLQRAQDQHEFYSSSFFDHKIGIQI